MIYRELLLGCGSRTVKDMYLPDQGKEFKNVTRLDINPDHGPDIIFDLTKHPLPFADEEFDEVHAYDVLEHLAYQGDYEFFFKEFTEYHRILKSRGLFFASVPLVSSVWAWGDPSHKRVIQRETLTYLCQKSYEEQVGKTKISDFRYIYKADFDIVHTQDKDDTFYFILRKK